MPMIILNAGGATESSADTTEWKFNVRQLNLPKGCDHVIGVRWLSMTMGSDTSANADEEFSFPFLIKSNLIKRTDHLLTSTTLIPRTDRILAFVDLNESTVYEPDATSSQRNVEFEKHYFADMENVDEGEITIQFAELDGTTLSFANTSTIVNFTLVLEYRKKYHHV